MLLRSLLAVAFRSQITAPDAEAGVARLAELADRSAPLRGWHEAVAGAVRQGLIHDPVRLLAGALQCHWRLELTPTGVAEARRLRPDLTAVSSDLPR